MTTEPQDENDGPLYALVRFLYDCLAAQTEWGRNLNVLARKATLLAPLTCDQHEELGTKGSLTLTSSTAIELGNRFATAGSDSALTLGALFLVGRIPASGEKPERPVCAPLLEIPLGLKRDLARGSISVEPEDAEFSINFSLLGEILRTDRDDLQDRLADLGELVPDFPIDPTEFRDFWNGFRMIATGVPLIDELPRPRRRRRKQTENTEPSTDAKKPTASMDGIPDYQQSQPRSSNVDDPEPLRMVDFYLPRISKDTQFRLLPAATIILGKRAGHIFSALRELDGMTRQRLDCTAFNAIFGAGLQGLEGSDRAGGDDSATAKDAQPQYHPHSQPETGLNGSSYLPVTRTSNEVLLKLKDAFPLPLTATQKDVVRSARSAPLTVVTGPPGTGKSYTITAIVLDALLSGHSVMVTSQMDKAVEVVVRHVEQIAGPFAIARAGGRHAQRALADKIQRLTGPKTTLRSIEDASKEKREQTARQHSELSERLAKLEQRYLDAVRSEQVWSDSHDAHQRLGAICPLPVHAISRDEYRRAKGSARRARAASVAESNQIRLPVENVTLRTFVRARLAVKSARELLRGQPGFFARWRASRLKQQAVRMFGVKSRHAYSVDDAEQALQRWWSAWNKRRALQNLRVSADWDCSLDELDEGVLVQGYAVAMREAEQKLRTPFMADLLWQEIADLERQRTDKALELLRLNRRATLFDLTHGKCETCRGTRRVKCSVCQGRGFVPRSCGSCSGSGRKDGPCRSCSGRGWSLRYFGKCPDCQGSGRTNSCYPCDGTGTLEQTKKCSKCRGAKSKRCPTCRGRDVGPGRKQLRLFASLLRRRDRKLRRDLRKKIDLSVPLRAFPGWASTNRTLGQLLPATPGLFDLVVIDEASQCDLATAAVALLRGRRVVVVGDPNQLRHVSFLSKVREHASFVKHGLDTDLQERFRYRRSLFDVASDAVPQQHFFMLDQHFRSDPHIIDFSNSKFYDGELRIMTERPRRAAYSAIRCVAAEGSRAEGSSINPTEVQAVLAEVAAIVRNDEPQHPASSIGIVSPFRDHVDAIRDQLVRQFSAADIDKHAIVVGTAHALQGDEKDIVFFTTSIDPHCHAASLRFLENPNLFNVAVTRARKQLVIVTSVTADHLPAGLLRDFLQHIQLARHPQPNSTHFENEFVKEVVTKLQLQGLTVWPHYRSAGVQIDAVVSTDPQHVAVLCDGPAESDPSIDPLTCHRILIRAGWNVKRVPRRSWVTNWYDCFQHVQD